MEKQTRVYIAEDHQMLREGLKAILSTRSDLKIVGEAVDGLEAIRGVKRHQPDLMLLDLSMPRMSGISVLMEAKACHPDIKILVITIHESEAYIMETLNAGANGYCSKNDSREELMLAIDIVLAGNIHLSKSVTKNVVDGFLANWKQNQTETSWSTLSRREKEVLKMLAEGYSSKEISAMLFISTKTVEKHRSNIMAKLDLHSVANLTRIAIEKGLVEIRPIHTQPAPAA